MEPDSSKSKKSINHNSTSFGPTRSTGMAPAATMWRVVQLNCNATSPCGDYLHSQANAE